MLNYLKKPIEPTELIARVRTALKLAEDQAAAKAKEQIELVKLKRENLLKGLLPPEVLLSSEETGEIMPRRSRNVSVVMADLVDFTVKSQKMSPRRLLDELQTIFTAFDEITEKYKCTRIKTIGDAYMAVSGMGTKQKTMHSMLLSWLIACDNISSNTITRTRSTGK